MFTTRAPPTSAGRQPPYAFLNRRFRSNLRGPVVFFGVIAMIWALVWANDAFRSISPDQRDAPTFVKFDIALGVLYSVGALIEAYGIFAAIRSQIPLMRIYAYLSFFSIPLVAAIEIMRLVLHFVFKQTILDVCFKDYQGSTVTTTSGNVFHPHTTTTALSDQQVKDLCNNGWNNETFRDIAWLLVAIILGVIFAAFNFAYYRQLVDPSLLRTQAPSAAYQMNATRNAFGYQNTRNAGGYNPYPSQSYEQYVPAYEPSKLPNYDGSIPHDEDEKVGYSGTAAGGGYNPFADPAPSNESHNYAPPPGAPPSGGMNHDRDEGFDPSALQAAMEASKKGGADASGKV